MSYDQLVRLFPDGKTVHIAADGRTLARYDEARAEIEASGGVSVPPPTQGKNIFAWLFGGGAGEDEHEDPASTPPEATQETAIAQNDKATDDDNSREVATAQAEKAEPAADDKQSADDDDLPEPPRRPADLLALADIPLPPTRPDNQAAMALPAATPVAAAPAKPDAIGKLLAASPVKTAELPGLITQGPNDGRATQGMSRSATASQQSGSEVLAYAPVAQMEGLRSAAHGRTAAEASGHVAEAKRDAIVPARLDGSNFRSVTAATETAEMESQTIFGPTLTGLRTAARVETAALSDRLESSYLTRFSIAATDLSTDHFSGPSVASIGADKSRMVFVASYAGRQDGE